MTYRERREAKAARLREWAGKREQKAAAAHEQASARADMIPFGQPILVGHHSEGRHRRDLDRIQSGYRRSFEHAEKAREMARRADSIEAAADKAIYSDDDDAIERLAERIADLEAERDTIKAYNATARKGEPDWSLLTERQKRDLLSAIRFGSGDSDKPVFPKYVLANLSGNINRQRKRLNTLKLQQDPESSSD